MQAIDTSPLYEPSEDVIGKALAHPRITECYSRSDYVLMTKVGHILGGHFDYTPAGVRASILRSMARLGTSFLDVVFCHDIECVTDQDTLGAVGVLLDFVKQGKIRSIGLSSYRIDILAHRARLVREKCGHPVDVIQSWGQLTLQNSRLETEGLQAFKDAGVSFVLASSPLGIGLLRNGGVPAGQLGDAHPAPLGLRSASQEAAEWAETQGDRLAAVALRFSLWRAQTASDTSLCIGVITGVSSVAEVRENVASARKILGDPRKSNVDSTQVRHDQPLFEGVQKILGPWVDWCFTSPPDGWSQELKCTINKRQIS